MASRLSDELAIESADAIQRHHGNIKAAATELGIKWHTCRDRARVASERNLTGFASGGPIPTGFAVKGTSTLYGPDGKVKAEWVKTDRDALDNDAISRIREAVEGIKPADPVAPPEYADSELLACYPIPDLHMSMRAWAPETGENYDCKIAKERLQSMMRRATALTPPAHTGIVLGLGDNSHVNDASNMTPKSKHVLDGDGRLFNTTDMTIEAFGGAIEGARTKHQRIIVRILPGNHDPDAYLAVMFALAERYRNDDRVEVQKVPGEFFVHQHGKVMVAAHHGDKSKPEQIVLFMADQYREIWGETEHRHLFTGHRHSYMAKDIGGVEWESLRAIAARDAYAVSHAYSGRSDMRPIIFDRQDGWVGRVRVPARPVVE